MFKAVCAALFLLLLHPLVNLFANYRAALRTKLPVIVTPVDIYNPIWILVQSKIRFLAKYLPGRWKNVSFRGWQYGNKRDLQDELGNSFVIATPRQNVVFLGDMAAIDEVFKRRRDFPKATRLYGPLSVFGPNVVVSSGPSWQKYRKLSAPQFSEARMSAVWNVALHQASLLKNQWCLGNPGAVISTADDVKRMAMSVLMFAAFGIKADYSGEEKNRQTGDIGFHLAFRSLVEQLYLVVGLPKWLLLSPLAPKAWQDVGHSLDFVQNEITRYVEEKGRQVKSQDLIHTFLQQFTSFEPEAHNAYDSQNPVKNKSSTPMTAEEILANIYVIAIAGYETSGNSIYFAILFLAMESQYQDWIKEEIKAVTEEHNLSDYRQVYPHLVRCQAVIMETLRLMPVVPAVPKVTQKPTAITVNDRSCELVPDTLVMLDMASVQRDPSVWGEDAEEFRPSRWLVGSEKGEDSRSSGQQEFLRDNVGNYFAWSQDSRNCPGKKFSQVELVAALTVLFRENGVSLVGRPNETASATKERIRKEFSNVRMGLSVQLKRARNIPLEWHHSH